MPRPNLPSNPTFGFLSTLETAEFGYFGGYLVVNTLGRPLEFHCTAPVRPSRAQEILYGPTLHAYLLGEQMGGALLREANLQPNLILTNRTATFSLRPSLKCPLVHVAPQNGSASDEQGAKRPCVVSGNTSDPFVIARHEIRLPNGFETDQSYAAELLEILATHVELAEPFDRIEEAIREASRIGNVSQEHHGQDAA